MFQDLIYYPLGPGVEAFTTRRDSVLPYPVIQGHQVHGSNVAIINGFFVLLVSLIVALASFLYISNDENNMNILYRYISSLNGVAIVFLFSSTTQRTVS